MEFMQRINSAITYIEDHIKEEVNIEKAALIFGISEYHFRRMFSIFVGIPVHEYIRRRRLTMAAFDLQNETSLRVIDLAVLYGYSSADAFTRAFAAQHGKTPQQIRKENVNVCAYPRLSFHLKMKGGIFMKYRIENKPQMKAFGIEKEIINDGDSLQVPVFFKESIKNGKFEEIAKLAKSKYSYENQPTMSGICSYHKTDNGYLYMIGSLITNHNKPPIGYTHINIPESTWAIFESRHFKDNNEDVSIIQELWKQIYQDWLPTSGYKIADGPEIEQDYYHDPEDCYVEIWVPVIKK